MSGWLNPALDVAALSGVFAAKGHVRIPNLLIEARAVEVAVDLAQRTKWQVICANRSGTARLDPAEIAAWPAAKQAELSQSLMSAAAEGIGFTYMGVRLDDPADPLAAFHGALRASEIQSLIAAVSGRSDFNDVDAQATRFNPGHYLTRHRDDPEGERLRLAFVWGGTPKWHPDWGGLLQFFTEDGQPTDSWVSGFNTLDLFDVRHIHSVTAVAPFAASPRHVISGWFVQRDA